MLKVLICTNHMASIGGSEIVALEVAECFKKNNYLVDIVANYIDSPVIEIAKNSDINLFNTDELPNPFNYDIVWSQHQVLPILINHYIDSFNNKTFFVFAHLSPYEHLETFGLYTERLLANKIFFNSEETYNQLSNFGVPTHISEVFYNAAPSEFICEKYSKNEQLKNILLVSNHPPQEVLDALDILKNEHGLNIINIGVKGHIGRLTPKMIEDADAVITIGKTVQYAIVSDTPVYCYDHFGGIGWLLIDNYKNSEQFNYSGRCCLRRISASEIVDEIITYFPKAKHDVSKIKSETLTKYDLDNYIINIINIAKESISEKTLNLEDRQKIGSESEIVKSIKQYYNAYNRLVSEHKQLTINNNELIIKNSELNSENSMISARIEEQKLKHQELLTKFQEISYNNEELIKQKESISSELGQLIKEKESISNKLGHLIKEKESISNKLGHLVKEKESISNKLGQLIKEKESISNKMGQLIEQKEFISNKLQQLIEEYNNQLLENQLNLDNYNQLLNSYNKLETQYQKYKNTFFNRLTRRIKRLYNKNVD
ncbi:hypothetical protein B6D22_05180 [Gilliamella apicola]|uniref:hypothetical protein n=2 Tax=Gilliamella apicola TaxID=1196095 RepID=UPI000A353EFB|nr:hypothetical protein [Gilliamella apicola]OTQ23520.1 hypothetical protein B6D22_05180 [Gilliamella apicola]